MLSDSSTTLLAVGFGEPVLLISSYKLQLFSIAAAFPTLSCPTLLLVISQTHGKLKSQGPVRLTVRFIQGTDFRALLSSSKVEDMHYLCD